MFQRQTGDRDRATMSAMWRVGRAGAALLAIVLAIASRARRSASPEGESTQITASRRSGGLRAVRRRHQRHPDRAVRHGLGAGRLRETRRRTGTIGGHPDARDRRRGSASLVVNPGGPGASAVDTVAGMGAALADTEITAAASTWSASTRAASGTPRRSCGAAPTPSSTPTARADGRLQPGGRRAHRGALPPVRDGVRAADGHGLPGQRRHRVGRRATWTSCARRWARTRSTISASPTAPNSAPPTPTRYPDRVRAMVLDGAVDPSLGPHRPEHPPDGRDSKRLSTTTPPTARSRPAARWAPTRRQFVDRYHQLVDPLVTKPGRDVRSARPELPGRDHRHRQRAVHAAVLDST